MAAAAAVPPAPMGSADYKTRFTQLLALEPGTSISFRLVTPGDPQAQDTHLAKIRTSNTTSKTIIVKTLTARPVDIILGEDRSTLMNPYGATGIVAIGPLVQGDSLADTVQSFDASKVWTWSMALNSPGSGLMADFYLYSYYKITTDSAEWMVREKFNLDSILLLMRRGVPPEKIGDSNWVQLNMHRLFADRKRPAPPKAGGKGAAVAAQPTMSSSQLYVKLIEYGEKHLGRAYYMLGTITMADLE